MPQKYKGYRKYKGYLKESAPQIQRLPQILTTQIIRLTQIDAGTDTRIFQNQSLRNENISVDKNLKSNKSPNKYEGCPKCMPVGSFVIF